MNMYRLLDGFAITQPSIAQLVERRTVVYAIQLQISLGHWFESGSRENFFYLFLNLLCLAHDEGTCVAISLHYSLEICLVLKLTLKSIDMPRFIKGLVKSMTVSLA